jgi:hypothetical protein
MRRVRRRSTLAFVAVILLALAISAPGALGRGQSPPIKKILDLPLYDALKQFDLTGGVAQADGMVLQRDRVKMTFNGTFYFESPIEGRIRGAVFIGQGEVVANPPDDTFERTNVQRMIKADRVESTFKTAVFRFSDDTPDALGLKPNLVQPVPQQAHDLAIGFPRRLLKETGANVNARIVVSILNHESPGFFSAEFDGGSRGRFGFVLDYQARVPEAHFGLDGGEKGLFFAYDDVIFQPDVWMVFLSLQEYKTGTRDYSDAHVIIDIKRYDMDINLRDGRTMRLQARMNITALTDGLKAIPLVLNEDLTTYFNQSRDRSLRVRDARLGSGEPIVAIQESWDGSVTLVLPEPIAKGQQVDVLVDMKGEYLLGSSSRKFRFALGPDRGIRAKCPWNLLSSISRSITIRELSLTRSGPSFARRRRETEVY